MYKQHGMVKKRVNNTDPVVQVRLRVMEGNFHGTSKKGPPSGGFCVFKSRRFLLRLGRGAGYEHAESRYAEAT